MMASPSNSSRFPWNIASRVEIIRDLPNLRGRARKNIFLPSAVAR